MRKNTRDAEGHVLPCSYLVDVRVCLQRVVMEEVLTSFVVGGWVGTWLCCANFRLQNQTKNSFTRDFTVRASGWKNSSSAALVLCKENKTRPRTHPYFLHNLWRHLFLSPTLTLRQKEFLIAFLLLQLFPLSIVSPVQPLDVKALLFVLLPTYWTIRTEGTT